MNKHCANEIIDAAPVLLVADIRAAVSFYQEKLGFVVDQIHGEPPSFAMANAGETTIMLKQAKSGPCPNSQSLAGFWDVYLWVRDINAVAESLVRRDVAIIRGPEMTSHGCEELDIRDPDGHVIVFGYCP